MTFEEKVAKLRAVEGKVTVRDYFPTEREPYRYGTLEVQTVDASLIGSLAALTAELDGYLTFSGQSIMIAVSRPLTAEEIDANPSRESREVAA